MEQHGSSERRPLSGKVAVVAGATRGAGRGIACALGEAGATVYCTGRSVAGSPATEGRTETLEETAEMVTACGGQGIAVRTDHLEEDQVRALFEQVSREQSGLDLLVNDVWGGDALTEWGTPFWQLDLAKGHAMLERAVWSHILTARLGLPLLIARGAGLVVEVTDGELPGYRGSFFYDLVKSTVVRVAYGLACELARAGHERITAVAVTPGFLRSEAMLDHFGVTESNWRDATQRDPHFIASETPRFVGRAVAALAAQTEVSERAGRVWSSWQLAREFGFTDLDGARPDWGAYFERTAASLLDRGGPYRDDERAFLEMRYYQIHPEPSLAVEARTLREALVSAGAPPPLAW